MMMAMADDSCVICGGRFLRPLISLNDVPTLCNRLCASRAEAENAPRGHILLSYCIDCGHIFNSAFDEERVNYDGQYENTLTFSPRYRQYAQTMADRIISSHGLVGKNIVEIGCGSGNFLRLLCDPGNHGEGYDPSQSTSRSAAGLGSVEIIGRTFAVEDARCADLVCCRQVLEHLPRPMDLLRKLRETINVGAGVCFEVPNGLFTLDRLGIWDIIYEHVSYFTPCSLVRAFDDAGFTVCCVESMFDDQYLWLEARVDGRASSINPPRRSPTALYGSFAGRFTESVAQWRQRVEEWRSEHRKIVIWGAGSKGIMFLNFLGEAASAGIDCVVDINPRKHGHFVPIVGQEIVGPERLLQNPPDLLVVMNPEYTREVQAMIDDMGIGCEVVNA
jgi:SAM-dependent methyltransferase